MAEKGTVVVGGLAFLFDLHGLSHVPVLSPAHLVFRELRSSLGVVVQPCADQAEELSQRSLKVYILTLCI